MEYNPKIPATPFVTWFMVFVKVFSFLQETMGSLCCKRMVIYQSELPEGEKIIEENDTLCVATWNVHEWKDEGHGSNFDAIIEYLHQSLHDKIDILGFSKSF